MPRGVGLDIGSRYLKLVELTGSAKSFKVHRLIVREVPQGEGPEAAAARTDLVKSVFAEARVSKDDVCASFDAGSTIFRDIQVPFREDDKIAKVVRFQAENHLHGRAIEDVVVNWVKTGETKDGSQLLIFAAPKKDLADDLQVLRAAGVEPASVDLDATALYTACEGAGVFRETPSVVVAEIGARTTNILLVDGGNLRAVRSFRTGAESVTSALQQDLSLPSGEASQRAQGRGSTEGALLVPAPTPAERGETGKSVAELERDAAEARREEFVAKVEREIRRSLAAVRTETPPAKVLVAGGGSLLPGFGDALASRMGIPVEPLGLLTRIGGWRSTGTDAAFEEASAPVAVGCAMRVLGADPLGVEMRQEEFAPSNTFDVVKTSLAIGVTLLFLFTLGMFWVTKEEFEKEREQFLTGPTSVCTRAQSLYFEVERQYQIERLNKDPGKAKDAATAARDSLPNDETYLTTILGRLRQRYRDLETQLGLSKDVPPIESASKVWKEVMAALNALPREQLGWFALTDLNVSPTVATVKFEIGDQSTVDTILKALNGSPYFRERAKDPNRPWSRGGLNTNTATGRSTGSVECAFKES